MALADLTLDELRAELHTTAMQLTGLYDHRNAILAEIKKREFNAEAQRKVAVMNQAERDAIRLALEAA